LRRRARARSSRIRTVPGASPSARGGRSHDYQDWTKKELAERAREIGIKGRSSMTKPQLISALRNH